MEQRPKPRVFALQKQSRYDISAAKFYSKDTVYIVNDERINPFDTNELVELIQHRLVMEDFNPDIDFICLTGSSVLLSLFFGTIVRKFNFASSFKVLIYDARRSNYRLRIMNFGD